MRASFESLMTLMSAEFAEGANCRGMLVFSVFSVPQRHQRFHLS